MIRSINLKRWTEPANTQRLVQGVIVPCGHMVAELLRKDKFDARNAHQPNSEYEHCVPLAGTNAFAAWSGATRSSCGENCGQSQRNRSRSNHKYTDYFS